MISSAEIGVALSAPLVLDRSERRSIFYLKTDVKLRDLQSLRARAECALRERTSVIAGLAAEFGYATHAEPIAAGSYHVVHKIGSAKTGLAVVRSTLSGVFAEDRSLLAESFARHWLSGCGQGDRVPRTYAVRFIKDGAPFDFAVSEFVTSPCLRDLGDSILDEEPHWLFALGRVLRDTHVVEGSGAGLLDTDYDEPPKAPIGVHYAWGDYMFLNLKAHVQTCRDAALIDAALAAHIMHLSEAMRPALDNRPMRLLHGDPGTHNVCVSLTTKQVVSLLDWEDSLVGDPLFDVAMAATFQPPRRSPPLMDGYGLGAASVEERRLLAFYFLRISLSKTVHRFRFGIPDQPGRTPGHHRIFRGVEELGRLL